MNSAHPFNFIAFVFFFPTNSWPLCLFIFCIPLLIVLSALPSVSFCLPFRPSLPPFRSQFGGELIGFKTPASLKTAGLKLFCSEFSNCEQQEFEQPSYLQHVSQYRLVTAHQHLLIHRSWLCTPRVSRICLVWTINSMDGFCRRHCRCDVVQAAFFLLKTVI